MANPPGYDGTEKDTEAVTGSVGPAASGTAAAAASQDTAGAGGGSRATEASSPPVGSTVDTEGASGGSGAAGVSTALHGTIDTLQPGQIGVGDANPVYRAPAGLVTMTSERDTTRTDVQPGGSLTNPVPASQTAANLDTSTIGAAGSGTGLTQPATPTGVTAVTGPRSVIVSWTAVADIANDPTMEYWVTSSAGGTTRAPKNATSVVVTTLTPDRTYRFQVAARNRAGLSANSASSAAVRPYNPDVPDVLRPIGLLAANVVNPVYLPNGSVKGGTGGTNNAPVLGAVTPGAVASKTVTVTWAAPTVGTAPTSYVVTASTGVTFPAAGGATSKACVFAVAGASVTFTVAAVNATGPGAVSAPSAVVTVP